MFKEKPTGYFSRKIEIKRSEGKGLGIFAIEDLPAHYCIERCHCIVFSAEALKHLSLLRDTRHVLHDYIFKWTASEVCIALGNGSVYNHSAYANVAWKVRSALSESEPGIEYWTKRPIKKGEELYIRYTHPDSIADGRYTGVEDEMVNDKLFSR
jgi:hypothetical protein